jgi:hypothetical protein
MVDIEKSLAGFSGAAKRLNEKSNRINDLIKRVEQQLEAANSGVAFWPGWLLEESEGGFTAYLGYDKVASERRWQFVVRTYRTIPTVAEIEALNLRADETGEEQEFTPLLTDERPLLQEERNIRIKALNHLGDFVNSYCEKIERMVETIDEAEKSLK